MDWKSGSGQSGKYLLETCDPKLTAADAALTQRMPSERVGQRVNTV